MAITGPASYLPTADEFIAHWEGANSAFGSAISVVGGVTVEQLQQLRDDLAAARTTITRRLNDQEYARSDIYRLATGLDARVEQFRARIEAVYPDTKWADAMPRRFDPRASMDKVVTPLDDLLSVWGSLNQTADSEVVLIGGYTVEQAGHEIYALKEAYATYNKAVVGVKMARSERNALQEQIYPILKQYRSVIPSYFAPNSAVAESLPRLTPKPGSTPKPVNASAVWDEAEGKARIAFEASDNAHLKEYQVRYTPGPDYDEDDAAVVANIAPDAPRELLTDAGLTQPGAASSFKVFVILTTGNEAGSDAMTVERPQ